MANRAAVALDDVRGKISGLSEELVFMDAIAAGAFDNVDVGLFARSGEDPTGIESFGQRLANALQRARNEYQKFVSEAGGGGGASGSGSGLPVPNLSASLSAAAPAGAGSVGQIQAGVLQGLEGLQQKAERIRASMRNAAIESGVAWTVARSGIETFSQGLGQAIGQVLTFQEGISGIADAVRSMGSVIQRTMQRVISQLASAVAQAALFTAAVSLIPGLNAIGGASSFGGFFKNIIGLSSGGIVPAQGQFGGLYRLGDKNQAEAVIPLDRLNTVAQQFGGTQRIEIVPSVLPNGDLAFANRKAGSNRSRLGYT
jgi:hypothetical protein